MKTIKALFSKSLIVLTLLTLIHLDIAISQNQGWIKISKFEYGIQINQLFDGSGHGMLTDMDLIFKIGTSQVATGIFTQSKFQKISGISFQYKYFISENKYASLYGHYTIMYHYQNCLNDNLNKLFHPQDYSSCCEFEKFNTLVNQIGIGIESKMIRNLFIDFKIGIGGYLSHIDGKDNRNNNVIVRDDKGTAFMSSLGLVYKIKAKDKKQKFGKF